MKTAEIVLADHRRARMVEAGSTSRDSLTSLVYEGAYANVFVVLTGGAFLAGMALFLGANDLQIGLLAAAPFLMQFAQVLSPFLFRDLLRPELGQCHFSATPGYCGFSRYRFSFCQDGGSCPY